MCWDISVSIYFSLIYIMSNIYYVKCKPKYWQTYLLFSTFYLIMELFQCFQWIYGYVYDHSIYGIRNCHIINTYFTFIAHILIWLQPIMFSYIGYTTNKNKDIFKLLIPINIILFLYSCLILYLGFIYPNKNSYIIENSVYGLSTCTNRGLTGHLVWKFKPYYLEYFPNYLMYLVMCILSFLSYDRNESRIIGIGWILSLLITEIILRPTIVEVASSWCLLSIVANFTILFSIIYQ